MYVYSHAFTKSKLLIIFCSLGEQSTHPSVWLPSRSQRQRLLAGICVPDRCGTEYVCTQHNMTVHLTARAVVVLLTLLRRYLEPVAFGTSDISATVPIPVSLPWLTAFCTAVDGNSYSSVLLCTMYRDGGSLRFLLKACSRTLTCSP